MRRTGLIALGLALGCLQLGLRGLGVDWVIINLPLVWLVTYLNRWQFQDLAAVAIAAGIMLEIGSGLTIGTQVISLLLIVLIGKLTLNQVTEGSQLSFSLVLGGIATVAYNLAVDFSLAPREVLGAGRSIGLRIMLEVLYTIVSIALLSLAVSARQTKQGAYHFKATSRRSR